MSYSEEFYHLIVYYKSNPLIINLKSLSNVFFVNLTKKTFERLLSGVISEVKWSE